jgi:hypothetical protein
MLSGRGTAPSQTMLLLLPDPDASAWTASFLVNRRSFPMPTLSTGITMASSANPGIEEETSGRGEENVPVLEHENEQCSQVTALPSSLPYHPASCTFPCATRKTVFVLTDLVVHCQFLSPFVDYWTSYVPRLYVVESKPLNRRFSRRRQLTLELLTVLFTPSKSYITTVPITTDTRHEAYSPTIP